MADTDTTLQPRTPSQTQTLQHHLRLATQALATDYTSGARQLASLALSSFSTLLPHAALTCHTREELWNQFLFITRELVAARPSMSAAVRAGLVRGLGGTREVWDGFGEGGGEEKETEKFVEIAQERIAEILEARNASTAKLADVFVAYISDWLKARKSAIPSGGAREKRPLRILTLSNSSTIRTALLGLVSHHPTLPVHLTVLESRPRCEAADLAASLLSSLPPRAKENWKFTIAPDCAVATVARGVDILLLGADRISRQGDVSNKLGSLAAAICVRHQNAEGGKVLVLSESDKIVAEAREGGKVEEVETHPIEEMSGAWQVETREVLEREGVGVFGEWFEWVGKELVDGYVTERGVLDREGVSGVAGEIEELERAVFGDDKG